MSEAAVTAWVPPDIDGPVANRKSRYSAAELDAVGRQAWEEGFARGLDAGQAAARQQQQAELLALQQRSRRLQEVLDFLAAPLAELDVAVEQQLVALACAVARHVVRRELHLDPAQVIAVVRETVALLPVGARDVRVHLHPEDAAILRERLAETHDRRAWSIVEDPVLQRGGCRVVTDDSQIDARVETRIGAVVASVLGDQRAPAGAGAGSAAP